MSKKQIANRLLNIYTAFIIYSIIGWLFELTIWIFKENQIINRGFLYGPWLPIYGFGGLIIYALCYKFATRPLYIGKCRTNIKPFIVFVIISLSACMTELISTYIMDCIGFDFKNLWEYSEYRLNFQQRIALIPSIQFGLLGILIIYKFVPRINAFLNDETNAARNKKLILISLFTIDLIVHLFIGNTYIDKPILIL